MLGELRMKVEFPENFQNSAAEVSRLHDHLEIVLLGLGYGCFEGGMRLITGIDPADRQV